MSFADILEKIVRSGSDKLAAKLPSWAGLAIEVPASLNYQQCSSEATARYKASLVPEGARVADLTGGLGADSWAFSLRASAVWYNERDSVLLDAVKKNFAALGISNVVFNGYDISLEDSGWQDDLRAFPPDVIYLDPARRDFAGKKVFLLEDCSPDVVGLMPLLLGIAPLVMVKVSPMADITMLRRRLRRGVQGTPLPLPPRCLVPWHCARRRWPRSAGFSLHIISFFRSFDRFRLISAEFSRNRAGSRRSGGRDRLRKPWPPVAM